MASSAARRRAAPLPSFLTVCLVSFSLSLAIAVLPPAAGAAIAGDETQKTLSPPSLRSPMPSPSLPMSSAHPASPVSSPASPASPASPPSPPSPPEEKDSFPVYATGTGTFAAFPPAGRGDASLGPEWREFMVPPPNPNAGKTFWFNTKTSQRTWIKPPSSTSTSGGGGGSGGSGGNGGSGGTGSGSGSGSGLLWKTVVSGFSD